MSRNHPTSREQWFKDRIGKIIFRNKSSCSCVPCEFVYNNGVKIIDEMHAYYLCGIECETDIKYFDSIEERNKFKKE